MPLGTCKAWLASKGFGFIVSDSGDGDVFVHITELKKSGLFGLAEGDRVEYQIALDRGRPKAVRVRLDHADRDMA